MEKITIWLQDKILKFYYYAIRNKSLSDADLLLYVYYIGITTVQSEKKKQLK